MAKSNKLFMFTNMAMYFVTGMTVLSLSAELPLLAKSYALGTDLTGLLMTIFMAGYLLFNLITGILASRLGRRTMLVLAALAIGSGFGLLTLLQTRVFLYALVFLAGSGVGIFNNLINVLVSEATNGSSASINVVHTCYATGAFVAPLVVVAFTSLDFTFKAPLLFVAVLSLALLPMIAFMPLHPPVQTAPAKQGQNPLRFLRDPNFYLFFFILFFYVGSENGLNSWVPTFLSEQGLFSLEQAQTLLSVFWVVMIIGRLLVASISKKKSNVALLLLSTCGFALFATLFILLKVPVLLVITVVLLGFSMAGIFTLTISQASYLVIGSNVASGLLLASGGVGSMVVPLGVGVLGKAVSLTAGMWYLAGAVGIMTLLSLSYALRAKTGKGAPEKDR